MPANLEISCSVSCKMMCSYCPQASHVANYAEKVGGGAKSNSAAFMLTLDNFFNYLCTVPTSTDIVFAGMAEPFLNKNCLKMIDHAFYKGHLISVYTTGAGMSLEDAHNLKNYTYNHFCLHLPDGDGIMNLKVTPEYLEVLKVLMTIQNNIMCIGNLHPEVQKITGPVPSGEHGLFSRGGTLKHLMPPRKTGKIWCSSCSENLDHNVLLPNGDVLLCCMDYNQKHVIGNLNDMPYADVFTSPEYMKVKNGMNNESIDILCRTCEVSTKRN